MKCRKISVVAPLLMFFITFACVAEPRPPVIECIDDCVSTPDPSDREAIYDLGAFDIPFENEFNWPLEPRTTQTINVSAGDSAAFLAALSTAETRVVVPAGTYYGTPNIARDVDIVLDNGAIVVVTGTFTTANDRIRWTGGVIDGGDSAIYQNTGDDIMWNNVRIDNMQAFLPGFGSPVERYAMINSTLNANGAVLFNQGSSGAAYSDFIIAGSDIFSGSSAYAIRMQRMNRGIVVDNRIQGERYHSLRAHWGSNDIYWGNNLLTAGTLLNVARNGGGASESPADNLGNIYVIGNTTYNATSPQTGFNRLANSGEGPQIWRDNQAFVQGITSTFVDESGRWPNPVNPGDISENNTRSPYGAGPTSFSDWVNDFSNGADHQHSKM